MSTISTFKTFIQNSNDFNIIKLHSGQVSSLEEFYNQVVLINSPKIEVVKKWHDLLLRYIKDEDAVFFVRRYASAPKKDWTKIRRGFLTEYDCGLKYVFCDNYFAHYFAMMVLNDIVPSYDEFKKSIIEREFPYGYMVTSQEKSYQAYKVGKTVNLNKAGWKLDHIYSVNADYNFDYKNEKELLFPIGIHSDWVKKKDANFFSRTNEHSPITLKNYKDKVKAHFLRLVHPMNYFLTPQKSRSSFDMGGTSAVIDYVKQQHKEKYGQLFTEFEQHIFASELKSTNKEIPETVYFGWNVLSRSNNKKNENDGKSIRVEAKLKSVDNSSITTIKIRKDFNRDINIVKAYLIEGRSYRKIEKEFLNIDSVNRGGGFIAMKLLNSYGINSNHKNKLSLNTFDSLAGNANDDLKLILMQLKDVL